MSVESGHLSPEELEVKEHHKNVLASWSDLLHRLQKNEVGRGIVSDKFGHRELIGYILPLGTLADSHLIIFKNGYMAITEPNRNVQESTSIYKMRTGKTVEDYLVRVERPTDVLRELLSSNDCAQRLGSVTLSNDSNETADAFRRQAERALLTIRSNILDRKRTVIATTGPVSNVLNSMLGEGILI